MVMWHAIFVTYLMGFLFQGNQTTKMSFELYETSDNTRKNLQ